jgi:hypothetical protein
MTLRIFACPECKCRKFETVIGLNTHLGKSHTVNYRIAIKNGKAYKVSKLRQRVKPIVVKVSHVHT